MKNLAIVAIPSQDDYVWKISSQKIPHMTLLFLGDQPDSINIKGIEEFLQHVVKTSLCRFGMDVDRRGELGEKKADVLFFRQYNVDKLNEFRSYLLNNDAIRKAYDSIPQFESFVPHLTLGYPETPAKPDKRDYTGIHWVNFDKIALWTGDFEGLEFPLKSEGTGEEVYMSSIVDNILAHHGVKGMKWGVRRDKGHEGQRAKLTKIAKLDKRFEREATSFNIAVKINNAGVKKTNSELHTINDKPKYKNADFTRDTPLRRQYYKEHQKLFIDNLEKAANDLGTNASGTKRYGVIDLGNRWDVIVRDVKHDDLSEANTFSVNVIKNETGHIVKLTLVDEMEQSSLADEFLSHFGIKGMQWGVRRTKAQLDSPSDDHTKAQEARRKAKKSGTKALSNQELQNLINRMNLEQQYSRIVPPSIGKRVLTTGARFVSEVLLNVGKQQASKVANDQATKLVSSLLKK